MSRLLALPFLAIIIGLLACGTSESPESPGTDALPTLAPTTSSAPTTGAGTVPGGSDLLEIGTEVGKTAPHFAFKLSDGTVRSTAQLAEQGKPVFLFFFATW